MSIIRQHLCECDHGADEHVALADYVVCTGCLRARPAADLKAPYRIVCTIYRPKQQAAA